MRCPVWTVLPRPSRIQTRPLQSCAVLYICAAMYGHLAGPAAALRTVRWVQRQQQRHTCLPASLGGGCSHRHGPCMLLDGVGQVGVEQQHCHIRVLQQVGNSSCGHRLWAGAVCAAGRWHRTSLLVQSCLQAMVCCSAHQCARVRARVRQCSICAAHAAI